MYRDPGHRQLPGRKTQLRNDGEPRRPQDTDHRAYSTVEDVSFTEPLSSLGIGVTLADLLR